MDSDTILHMGNMCGYYCSIGKFVDVIVRMSRNKLSNCVMVHYDQKGWELFSSLGVNGRDLICLSRE